MPKIVPEAGDIVWIAVRVRGLGVGWGDDAKLEVKFATDDRMYINSVEVDQLEYDTDRGFSWTPKPIPVVVEEEPASEEV